MDSQSTDFGREHQNISLGSEGGQSLTFAGVDGLAFAAERAKRPFVPKGMFVATDIGPFLELFHLSQDGTVPPLPTAFWFSAGNCAELLAALGADVPFWACPRTESAGILKVSDGRTDEATWLSFVSTAQKAAIKVGFSRAVALQLVAALEELVDNVEVHSRRKDTGYAAFRAAGNRFDFVVSDRGIGALKSFRECKEFSALLDHGDALQLALTDGYSRYGSGTQHGNGFRPLFTGLSNLSGSLRFRTGDHALTINGRNPRSIPWTKASKPKISGFFASISCSTSPR